MQRLLYTYLVVSRAPQYHGSFAHGVPCGLLPSGSRGPVPISASPLITFLCHGLLQHRRCLFNTGQFFFCGMSMKTTGIPSALFLSRKRPRLPILAIIHHRFHRLHHHHQKMRVECSLLPSILPSPCSLTTSCVFCVGPLPPMSTCTSSV